MVMQIIVSTAVAQPVYIPDETLKAAIEAQLGSDPTPADMNNLYALTCSSSDVEDLTGLEYATNLSYLNVQRNEIRSVTPLAGLTNLTHLDLNNNYIGSFSVLSGLTKLTFLDLHDQHYLTVSNISFLSGMNDLVTLNIYRHQIQDISVLSGLTELRHLDIYDNFISDLTPLVGLPNLSYVNCSRNPLNDNSCDNVIPQLESNGVYVYSSCGQLFLTITSTAGGHTDPKESEYTYVYGQTVTIWAIADPGYIFNGWTGSYSAPASMNPYIFAMNSHHHIQANFISDLDTLYIDDNASGDPGHGDATKSDPLEKGTPEHPFDSIQEAIDVAAEGATLYVRPGIYMETLDFRGKSLRLIGADSNDPNTTFPVINGYGSLQVVTFNYIRGPDCLLKGFVITGGVGFLSGAVYCNNSSPRIENCLLVGNRSTQPKGGTVYCSNSDAVFSNCTISGNVGGEQCACMYLVDSNVVITNSILWNNTLHEIILEGSSLPQVSYCDIAGNTSSDNGNIDTDPLFALPGYWANPLDMSRPAVDDLDDAVWVNGDYHLKSQQGRWDPITQQWATDEVTSPCIDTGDPTSPVGYEPSPHGDIINMGAYGGSIKASKSLADTTSDL
jgi:hypothetical protein